MSEKKITAQGSSFELEGPGPFLLPCFFPPLFLGLRGEKDRVQVQAVSFERERLQTDISFHAAEWLLTSQYPPLCSTGSEVSHVLEISGMQEPIELPYLHRFVRFVLVEPGFLVVEFLNEEGQRIHLPIDSEAYRLLLELLQAAPAVMESIKQRKRDRE